MKSSDHGAKTSPSVPLKRDSGEERIIVEAGSAVPLGDQAKRMVLGSAAGVFTVPDDLNDPLPRETEDLFW